MTAPLRHPILSERAQAALNWPIAPSQFDWQVLAVSPTRSPHVMQFSAKRYDLAEVIRRGDFEADWYGYPAFAVRDTKGRVVHFGPVLNALGDPKRPEAFAALVGERKAA